MRTPRTFRSFSWKDTNLRISSDQFELITATIMAQRRELEAYIRQQPAFQSALSPIPLLEQAPAIARRMGRAAELTGLGPMASVAGTLAQLGVEAAMAAGCGEAIVENGGDIALFSREAITIGIYPGSVLAGGLAFALRPEELPLAICSSSSTMGHSLSLGDCDLATVTAREAALADSVATLVANSISAAKDLESVLNRAGAIAGVQGILAVKSGKIGIWGSLPRLVRSSDPALVAKITRDRRSDFSGQP
ncbi:UPF0280 family protein [Desulfogranum mediterraneum]|uniref:UPF0280 family protein n=1 Tax=Desulfogranum mediterraneum TaxID=160661 RepID=UPI0003FD9AA9|nr:UPF0280 family protein [Desulfogranum mediterraneum]